MSWLQSIWQFLLIFLKQWIIFVPMLVLDPIDVPERLLGRSLNVSIFWTWLFFGLATFVALVRTFHTLRMENIRLKSKLNQQLPFNEILQRLKTEIETNLTLTGLSASHPDDKWLEQLYSHKEFSSLPKIFQDAVIQVRRRTIGLKDIGHLNLHAASMQHTNHYVPDAKILLAQIEQFLSSDSEGGTK